MMFTPFCFFPVVAFAFLVTIFANGNPLIVENIKEYDKYGYQSDRIVISGDQDVATRGKLVEAVNFGSSGTGFVEVNGVRFRNVTKLPTNPKRAEIINNSKPNHIFSIGGVQTSQQTGSFKEPYSKLSSDYRKLLSQGIFAKYDNPYRGYLQFKKLNSRSRYLIQIWLNDSSETVSLKRNIARVYSESDQFTYWAGGNEIVIGDSFYISKNKINKPGGLGMVLTFTAIPQEDILKMAVYGFNSVNAIQIRELESGEESSKKYKKIWPGKHIALMMDYTTDPSIFDEKITQKIIEDLGVIFDGYRKFYDQKNEVIPEGENGILQVRVSTRMESAMASFEEPEIMIPYKLFREAYDDYAKDVRGIPFEMAVILAKKFFAPSLSQKISYQVSKEKRLDFWSKAFATVMALELSQSNDFKFINGAQKKISSLKKLLSSYETNKKLTWYRAFRHAHLSWAPNTPLEDLLAALLLDLTNRHGGKLFLRNILRELPKLDDLKSPMQHYAARDNFYLAASRAAGKNLQQDFDRYKWAVSKKAKKNSHHAK